jgi:hypothetical protein
MLCRRRAKPNPIVRFATHSFIASHCVSSLPRAGARAPARQCAFEALARSRELEVTSTSMYSTGPWNEESCVFPLCPAPPPSPSLAMPSSPSAGRVRTISCCGSSRTTGTLRIDLAEVA